MAIFTESVCVNWFNESSNTYGIKFATSETEITQQWGTDVLSDKKVVQALNKAWPQIQKYRDEFIKAHLDDWYQDENGNYDYGANTVEKVLKFATLDAITLTQYKDGKISVDIWYNSYASRKDAEKFFGNHSLIIGFYIQKDYKVADMECQLAG